MVRGVEYIYDEMLRELRLFSLAREGFGELLGSSQKTKEAGLL